MEIAATVITTIMCMTMIFIGVMKIIERAHEKEIKLVEEDYQFTIDMLKAELQKYRDEEAAKTIMSLSGNGTSDCMLVNCTCRNPIIKHLSMNEVSKDCGYCGGRLR